jgi:hypothetical protein
LIIEPVWPRHAVEPDVAQVAQEGVHRRGVRTRRPADGVADAHDRARVGDAPDERDLGRRFSRQLPEGRR